MVDEASGAIESEGDEARRQTGVRRDKDLAGAGESSMYGGRGFGWRGTRNGRLRVENGRWSGGRGQCRSE